MGVWLDTCTDRSVHAVVGFFRSIAGWRARGRRRDASEAGGLAAASARRGMAEVEMEGVEGVEGAEGAEGAGGGGTSSVFVVTHAKVCEALNLRSSYATLKLKIVVKESKLQPEEHCPQPI